MIQAINMVTAALGNIIIMVTAKANMFDQVKYLFCLYYDVNTYLICQSEIQ